MTYNKDKINVSKVNTDKISCVVDVKDCPDNIIEAIMEGMCKATEAAQKIADENKKKEVKQENKRWKPEDGDSFYFVDCDYEIDSNYFNTYFKDDYDCCYSYKNMYKYRNIFKTEEEAEFEAERKKVIAELQNVADEYNGKFINYKYWIAYDENDNSLWVDSASYGYPIGSILFSSEEIGDKAIEIVGEDRIKKYLLGLEENTNKCESKSVNCNGDCEGCDYYENWDEEED